MTAQRSPFLIFLLLLLVVTSQNGQAHPAHKTHAVTVVHKRQTLVAEHKKHTVATGHTKHTVAAEHKKHTVAAEHKKRTATREHTSHTLAAWHKKYPATPVHKKHAIATAHEIIEDRAIQPTETMSESVRYALINSENNRITNPDQLAIVKEKLRRTIGSRKTVVRIVHIGDSHIQAGLMTNVLRRGLQSRYGNAGRGIVFPWQVAKTNGPSDIVSFSNNGWISGRLSLTNSAVECGVCGYGLQSDSKNWALEIGAKPERGDDDAFDIVRLFTGKNTGCFTLRYNGTEEKEVCMEPKNSFDAAVIPLRMKSRTIFLSRVSPDSTGFAFYGASFEKKNTPGIIYHSIGVNGAEFASYNSTPLFFDQIATLNADCYIISLGTNEAQRRNLNTEDFALQVRSLLTHLRQISPDAVFIITTPAPSFLNSVAINPKIRMVSEVLVKVSDEEKISSWDLYGISGGDKGLAMFQIYGLYRPDLLHFNKAGYELQGDMLLAALLKITL